MKSHIPCLFSLVKLHDKIKLSDVKNTQLASYIHVLFTLYRSLISLWNPVQEFSSFKKTQLAPATEQKPQTIGCKESVPDQESANLQQKDTGSDKYMRSYVPTALFQEIFQNQAATEQPSNASTNGYSIMCFVFLSARKLTQSNIASPQYFARRKQSRTSGFSRTDDLATCCPRS